MDDSDGDDALLLGGEAPGAESAQNAPLLPADVPSILDEFGEEMTAVLTPVSIWRARAARRACARL